MQNPAAKNDISSLEDIRILVDNFYGKVRSDSLLGPVFHQVIGENWGPHLDKMYRFWQTILLEEYTYSGSPFLPHRELPIQQDHFDRWLKLFRETLNEYFAGPKSDEASWRAGKMAAMFLSKLEYVRSAGGFPK